MSRKEEREIQEALRRHLRSRPGGRGVAQFDDPTIADRTVAIVGSTLVEHALEDAIAAHFRGDVDLMRRKLFAGDNERDGFVGSLLAKAWLAHALDVIGPATLADVGKIRFVRNVFAHSPDDLSFDTEAIKKSCDFSFMNRAPNFYSDRAKPTEAKEKFMWTCYHVFWLLDIVTVNRHLNSDDPSMYLYRSCLA